MLTKEAANALLKTLEEPPSHIVFILATTDPEKLPETILSRCQKIVFKQPDIETLAGRLLHVTKKEGNTKLSLEGAKKIAAHGKGSYRDALGILEQLLISLENVAEITAEKVEKYLGIPQEDELFALMEALCTKNTKGISKYIDTLKKSNGQALRTYDEFIEFVRKLLRLS